MDGPRVGTVGRIGRELRAGRWVVLATALVFAAAAMLALLLVGPRFEARISVRIEGPGAPGTPTLLAFAQTRDFTDGVATRLGEPSWAGPSARLPDRLVALLEGAPVQRTGPSHEGRAAQEVSIGKGRAADEVEVAALASTRSEAGDLVNAATAEFTQWLASQEPSPPTGMSATGDAQTLEREVGDLEEKLASLAPAEDAGLPGRLEAIESAEAGAREAIRASEERLRRLRAAESDPAADGDLAGLDETIATRRQLLQSFAQSVADLRGDLPQGNPRLRIAEERLAQLRDEVGALLRPAAERESLALDRLRSRGDELSSELASVRAGIARGEDRAESRRVVSDALASARDRLRSAQAAEPPSPLRVSVSDPTIREIAPPFGIVGALAGLAGLALGGIAVGARAFASRPSAAKDEEDPKVSVAPFGLAPLDGMEADIAPEPSGEEDIGAVAPEDGEHDPITTGEAAAALLASPVSRALVAATGEAAGPAASLALARRLSDEGQLVLLIDLSRTQTAAREAGVAEGAIGFREVAARSLGLSSVTAADEKSTTDIVAGGRRPVELPGGTAISEALRFARRAYDQVLVDCGALAPAEIVALADENCAVLLAIGETDDPGVRDRYRDLKAAGLDTALMRT